MIRFLFWLIEFWTRPIDSISHCSSLKTAFLGGTPEFFSTFLGGTFLTGWELGWEVFEFEVEGGWVEFSLGGIFFGGCVFFVCVCLVVFVVVFVVVDLGGCSTFLGGIFLGWEEKFEFEVSFGGTVLLWDLGGGSTFLGGIFCGAEETFLFNVLEVLLVEEDVVVVFETSVFFGGIFLGCDETFECDGSFGGTALFEDFGGGSDFLVVFFVGQ